MDRTSAAHEQGKVMEALREDLTELSRELQVSRRNWHHAEQKLAESQNRNASLKTQLVLARQQTPRAPQGVVTKLREELNAEHEYARKLEAKISDYRQRLYEQDRELRGLRLTLARVERQRNWERGEGARPLLTVNRDYRALRKYRWKLGR